VEYRSQLGGGILLTGVPGEGNAMMGCLSWLVLGLLLTGQVMAADPILLDSDGASGQFAVKNGVPSGFFADALREAFAAQGRTIEFHVRPWARCFEETRVGAVDGLFAIYRMEEREEQFLFSNEPLYVVHEEIFVRSGTDLDGAHWREALRGRRVGIVNGSYHGRLYEEAAAENLFSVETANSPDSLASMLAAGRIDAAFSTDELMGEALRHMHPRPAIEAAEPAVEARPVYLAFTKKRDMSAVRDAFDRELRKMKEDGRYAALLKRDER
jgi:polar amino acid transport system substrate-binding protein